MPLVISLIGGWQPRAEWCGPIRTQCHGTPSAACCRAGHCCCDMTARSRPATDPRPARTTAVPGRGVVKIASLPVATLFWADGQGADIGPTSRAAVLTSAIAPPYLITHAFLI